MPGPKNTKIMHCVIKLANVMGGQLENITFGDNKFHLPGGSPLSERIKNLRSCCS